MQNFDIVKNAEIEKTFRVARIMGDFDVKVEHVAERFTGKIEFPDNWQIGAIIGQSGTGKTTIAKELFADAYITSFEYKAKSVVDDMPKHSTMDEIEMMFYSVGFGSVPSWLKPYNVLSNGEKMRVDLARALLEKDFVVFDEFTSVVDRQVAQTASLAVSKCIRRNKNKKIVVVSCHNDILEWLQPDWVLNTDTMTSFFMSGHVQKRNSMSENVTEANGQNLGVITI